MKRIEKLRKWLKHIINKNHESLKDFTIDRLFDSNLCDAQGEDNLYSLINKSINDPGSIDGLDEINVTHEDLFAKLTTNCITPTKEDYELALKLSWEPEPQLNGVSEVQPKPKSKKKCDTKSENKIVMNL